MTFKISREKNNLRSVKLGLYKMTFQKECIIVTKEGENFHLTTCFNKRLNGFDVHFKNNTDPKRILKRYLIKEFDLNYFFDNNFEMFFKIIVEWAYKNVKKINLGKIKRHGFLVSVYDENTFFKSLLRGNKKERRTVVIENKNIKKRFYSKSITSIQSPDVLRKIPLDKIDKPFPLIGTKRKNRNQENFLMILNIQGKKVYYMTKLGNIQKFKEIGHSLLPTAFEKNLESFVSDFKKYFKCEDFEKELGIVDI